MLRPAVTVRAFAKSANALPLHKFGGIVIIVRMKMWLLIFVLMASFAFAEESSLRDRRELPQTFTRIYGMWFIDYFPYYNIGLAHYHLRNWKCATQSFRLSQMLEDIPTNSVQFYRLRELDSEAEQQLLIENP
jgi:hypothetical protein